MKQQTFHSQIFLNIDCVASGKKLKSLVHLSQYKTKDIVEITGVSPQAVYKWYRGESLPSLENYLILSNLLHVSVNELLVYQELVALLFIQNVHIDVAVDAGDSSPRRCLPNSIGSLIGSFGGEVR